MSKTLVPLDRNETGRSGCIGWSGDEHGPIAGFAEIDPNGLWSSPDEADAMAAEVCRRWNVAPAMLEALEGLLPWLEDAETKAVVGDEGCIWAVEIVRAAIAEYHKAAPTKASA